MRLPIGLAAMASLLLLGSGVVASTAAPQASNATEAPMETNETDAMLNTSGDADSRASQIAQCVADPSIHLPSGTNANLFCTCAVDKTMTGDVTQRDAIFQCAAQMHFSVPDLRTSEISECVSGSPGHLPDGADANAFCTCAVDKMLANTPQRDAINQCATEQHIEMQREE